MAYIGNTVQNQGFAPAIDYFNGDGTTVTFTLSRPVASVAQMVVAIDNVIQNPSSAFTVTGNSITFTSAPLSGTNNIWVEYTSLITTYAAISQDPSVIGDITASGGYLATGDFGNTFIDGTIVDYVTGNARITTGPADGLTIYNGGTTARTALAAWDTSGNFTNTGNVVTTGSVGVGTTSPTTKLEINSTTTQLNLTDNASTGNGNKTVNLTALKNGVGYHNLNYTAYQHAFLGGGSATEFMRIDTAGRAITPYQPYFEAILTVDQTGYDPGNFGAVVIYNNALTNIGSNYNTSTGKFTAPVSGKYIFHGAAYSSSQTYTQNWLSVNNGRANATDWAYNNASNFAIGFFLVNLAAGDSVGFHAYVGGQSSVTISANANHTYFKGYLLG